MIADKENENHGVLWKLKLDSMEKHMHASSVVAEYALALLEDQMKRKASSVEWSQSYERGVPQVPENAP